MKTVLWLLLCIPTGGIAQNETGVKFENSLSWPEVLTKAKTENKYIFVDVYASWCGPCKLMDQQVYPNDTIGSYLNDHFISVKVQMDSTDKDNEQIKEWYGDARAINEKYKIQGFPSFLFFTPDGELVSRELGYKDVNDFYKLASYALDPERTRYAMEIEQYKEGKRDYPRMGNLVKAARELQGDNALAATIALDYKTNYLDKLSTAELCTKGNLEFINGNINLINSKDKFFQLFYTEGKKVDSLLNDKGRSWQLVNYIINKEEIEEKLWANNMPVTRRPDWARIKSAISKKYGDAYVEQLFPAAELEFYKRSKNWSEFVRLRNKGLKEHSLKGGTSLNADAWTLNVDAWDLFLDCNDKTLLSDALKWSEISNQLLLPDTLVQCLDTKANLLYKLKRVDDAIALEEAVVQRICKRELELGVRKGFYSQEYVDNLSKMKNGLPTWNVK
jgi:thioredoxin-related protein